MADVVKATGAAICLSTAWRLVRPPSWERGQSEKCTAEVLLYHSGGSSSSQVRRGALSISVLPIAD